MKWSLLGSIGVAVALSLAACAERITTPANEDAERSALMQRTRELKARVVASGTMTGAQHRELELLAQDIGAWQSRTGRNDMRVVRSTPAVDAPESSVGLAIVRNPTTQPCAPCPPVKTYGDKICFLDGGTYCGKPGDTITRACSYICVFGIAAPDPSPTR